MSYTWVLSVPAFPLMNGSGRQRHQVFQRFKLSIVAAYYCKSSMGGGKWCHRQQQPEAAH